MTHAELVRVVAAGIVRTRFPHLAHDPAWTDKEIRESDLEEAASALSAIRAQGVALAYQTATGPMLRAGIAAFDLASAPMVAMDKSWSAMLAAGEMRPEEGRG